MYTPLGDNPEHVRQLCEALQLGESRGAPERLSGGFHHLVWRLETGRGTFVVKQLAPETDLGDGARTTRLDASERLAEAFAERGIGAIHALRSGEDYVQVRDDIGYLVYPWTDAAPLGEGVVSATHALRIARLLAAMHRADVEAPQLATEAEETATADELRDLVRRAKEEELACGDEIAARLEELECICADRAEASEVLERRQVVSHGDLGQKNVLWSDEGEPVLIDWEGARMVNPTREVLEVALDWSGLRAGFDETLFARFLRAYQIGGGTIEGQEIDAAVRAVLGAWVDWLVYNAGRALDPEQGQQHALGRRQVALALATITLLQRLAPTLTTLLEDEKLSSS